MYSDQSSHNNMMSMTRHLLISELANFTTKDVFLLVQPNQR